MINKRFSAYLFLMLFFQNFHFFDLMAQERKLLKSNPYYKVKIKGTSDAHKGYVYVNSLKAKTFEFPNIPFSIRFPIGMLRADITNSIRVSGGAEDDWRYSVYKGDKYFCKDLAITESCEFRANPAYELSQKEYVFENHISCIERSDVDAFLGNVTEYQNLYFRQYFKLRFKEHMDCSKLKGSIWTHELFFNSVAHQLKELSTYFTEGKGVRVLVNVNQTEQNGVYGVIVLGTKSIEKVLPITDEFDLNFIISKTGLENDNRNTES